MTMASEGWRRYTQHHYPTYGERRRLQNTHLLSLLILSGMCPRGDTPTLPPRRNSFRIIPAVLSLPEWLPRFGWDYTMKVDLVEGKVFVRDHGSGNGTLVRCHLPRRISDGEPHPEHSTDRKTAYL